MNTTGFVRRATPPPHWRQRRLLRSSQPRPNLHSPLQLTAEMKRCVWGLQQASRAPPTTQRKSKIDTNTRSRHIPEACLLSKIRRCHALLCNCHMCFAQSPGHHPACFDIFGPMFCSPPLPVVCSRRGHKWVAAMCQSHLRNSW